MPSSQLPASTTVVSSGDNELGNAAIGSTIALPVGNSMGVSSVTIVDEYQAASGRLCRRVEARQTDNEHRVMCQRSSGQWSFTRPLISSSLRQDLQENPQIVLPTVRDETITTNEVVDAASVAMVASTADLPVEPGLGSALDSAQSSTPPPVQLRLNPGETLWRFAARTTGNPENWSRIAELNGIRDVAKIQGGSMLNVPAELFAGKR